MWPCSTPTCASPPASSGTAISTSPWTRPSSSTWRRGLVRSCTSCTRPTGGSSTSTRRCWTRPCSQPLRPVTPGFDHRSVERRQDGRLYERPAVRAPRWRYPNRPHLWRPWHVHRHTERSSYSEDGTQRSSLIYVGRRGLGQRSPLLVLGLHTWSRQSRGAIVECTWYPGAAPAMGAVRRTETEMAPRPDTPIHLASLHPGRQPRASPRHHHRSTRRAVGMTNPQPLFTGCGVECG